MQTIIPPIPAEDRVPFGDPRLLARIWAKTRRNKETGCWEWSGKISDRGYGYVQIGRSSRRAHRVAYEVLVGEIPEGLTLDHLCRVRNCINPTHLEPVTAAENSRRSIPNPNRGHGSHRQREYCYQGHPWDENNTILRPDGARRCRSCQQASKRRRKATRRAEAAAQVQAYIDADGDRWEPAGITEDGDVLLACPEPQNPADAGDGNSFPWTLRTVRVAFGPLKAVAA